MKKYVLEVLVDDVVNANHVFADIAKRENINPGERVSIQVTSGPIKVGDQSFTGAWLSSLRLKERNYF